MRDIDKLCDVMRMIARQCDTCGGGKIELFAGDLSKIQRDAVEMLRMQQKEIDKSNEKILFLLDKIIEGRK